MSWKRVAVALIHRDQLLGVARLPDPFAAPFAAMARPILLASMSMNALTLVPWSSRCWARLRVAPPARHSMTAG